MVLVKSSIEIRQRDAENRDMRLSFRLPSRPGGEKPESDRIRNWWLRLQVARKVEGNRKGSIDDC